MARSKQEIQGEVAKIKDNNFDIKDHFPLIFANSLADKAKENDKVFVADELIYEESLEEQLQKDYTGKDYVLLFYAHRPHSPAISPYYPKEPRAHTSLLLCKVNEGGKIDNVLNIDGYSFPSYVDILGERTGATPNPHIKQRLVLQPQGSQDPSSKTPLQRASWQNMNCVLYAFTFAEQILHLFGEQPDLMQNLFPKGKNEKVSQESLFLLEEGIMEGMVDKYVRKSGPNYIYDQALARNHHDRLREDLAKAYETQHLKKEEHVTVVTQSQNIGEEEPSVHTVGATKKLKDEAASSSVVSVSLFKPPVITKLAATTKLLTLCTEYQSHLYEELQKIAKGKDLQITLQTHQINKQNPTELDRIIKKCTIVNDMIDALNDDKEPNELNRIENMKAILSPENKATLAEHRSTGGKFLNAILNVLSLIFRQDWSYKSKGEELSDNLENSSPKNI